MDKALKIIVSGRVQGVGFRPFVFHLADKYELKGTVQNNMDGVRIHVEGADDSLQKMVEELKDSPPRLSRIDHVWIEEIPLTGFSDFSIIPSERSGKSSLVIPIDSAVCDECLAEMKDPDNFRYRYPFINCTQCGPRYTIIDQLPYDRPFTAMKDFHMCEQCKVEYEDPSNRRHHAQPIACDECGPEAQLFSINGEKIARHDQAIVTAKKLLNQGKIIAIKGLGGYHLACDALNETAVKNLRMRKNRPNRPLAVMAASLNMINQVCYVSEKEIEVLKSPEAPIVVLKQREDHRPPLLLAPGLRTLGIMLPYTPLHHLLFDDGILELLVMTSANPSGMPILYKDDEAFEYLKDIADYILTSNRDIYHPVDDSVVQIVDWQLSFFRRSRGYVPDPFATKYEVHGIVALGSQQKNTFAIGRYQQIFLGPHIGDMENVEVIQHFKKEFNHLMKWMGVEAKVIAVDKHPYFSTGTIAHEMGGVVFPVQHHHAHMVACMEDNEIDDPSFGIILDGTGYGEDGNIWGFEILYGDASFYKRLAHLRYSPLPAGEKAVKEPWRNAAAMLISFSGNQGKEYAKQIFPDKINEIEIIDKMIQNRLNTPLAGTCGRLFDAVSAILGISLKSTYDGEAAIQLSELMLDAITVSGNYPYEIRESDNQIYEIDFTQMIQSIVQDKFEQRPIQEIVQSFHETIVAAIVETIIELSERNPDLNRKVMLSGGSFHNVFLKKEIKERLTNNGFEVFTHKKIPCNDGGLALGQLMIAAKHFTEEG